MYDKLFSNQLQSDKTDTVQQRIEWWMVVVDRGGRIPIDVYDYTFAEIFNLCRKTIDPETQRLVKLLTDRQIIP